MPSEKGLQGGRPTVSPGICRMLHGASSPAKLAGDHRLGNTHDLGHIAKFQSKSVAKDHCIGLLLGQKETQEIGFPDARPYTACESFPGHRGKAGAAQRCLPIPCQLCQSAVHHQLRGVLAPQPHLAVPEVDQAV